MRPTARRGRRPRLAALLAATCVASGCATAGTGSASAVATEAEWRALAVPRPDPLPGAARVSVAEIQVVGPLPWPAGAALAPGLGLEELVVAGLLRRPDVRFVERRRFTEAAEAERAGLPRPPGAPAAGVSEPADYVATVVWAELAPGLRSVEIRLADARTGLLATGNRVSVEAEVGPVALARSMVEGLLQALQTLERRPEWADPIAGADGTTRGPAVAEEHVSAFLRGVAQESTWAWEPARRSYLAALEDPDFFEARAALARAARLRRGGTLGES